MASVLVVGLAGCGGGNDRSADEERHLEQQIGDREVKALPLDGHFVGVPVITVNCQGNDCTASLYSTLAKKGWKGKFMNADSWDASDDTPQLKDGSNIVGFLRADLAKRCVERFYVTHREIALARCYETAHEGLP